MKYGVFKELFVMFEVVAQRCEKKRLLLVFQSYITYIKKPPPSSKGHRRSQQGYGLATQAPELQSPLTTSQQSISAT